MKKVVKFLVASAMVVAMATQFVGCSTVKTGGSSVGESSSSPSSSEISSVVSSEYPSSESELSSTPSSDISSIVSQIDKANSSSKVTSKPKPAASSSKPASSKPKPPASSSSKPVSSAPPASSTPPPPESKPEPPVQNSSEMKAVWLSFLEFQQFAGSDEYTFTQKIQSYFDTMVNKGLNTVIAQVRPHGDSFYPSQYYPWSKCVSGTMGQSVSYDPLAIMVSEAHSRGLSIHAWLNPYRTMNDKEMALIDDTFPVKQWYNSSNRADYMVQLGDDKRWWLKPGNAEVQQLIVNGAKEIAQSYKVDGIHLDDYFYGGALSYYGDSATQAKANTTALIKGLYDGIKSINSSVQFGISPAGGFSANNSLPSSDMGYLSTDLKLWCKNAGYIDYVMPQIYWEYDHKTQPYTTTFNKWQDFVTEDSVKLYIGLAPYKLSASIVENQVKDIKESYRATGYCLFRYDHIHNLNLS